MIGHRTASHWANLYAALREEMLQNRLIELLGPKIRPKDLDGRLCMYSFPDRVSIVTLDGKPILQIEGPDISQGMRTIWRTANFREIPA